MQHVPTVVERFGEEALEGVGITRDCLGRVQPMSRRFCRVRQIKGLDLLQRFAGQISHAHDLRGWSIHGSVENIRGRISLSSSANG